MGYILFDFQCTNCSHTFEDLHKDGEPNPPCPACSNDQMTGLTVKQAFCNSPTVQHNPFWAEIFGKTQAMRNKLTGKVPWRRSSESQTS